RAVVLHAVVEDARRHVRPSWKLPLVGELGEMARILRLRAAVAERREVGAGRDVLLAGGGAYLEEEPFRARTREELERPLAVRVARDAIVRRGMIVHRIEEPLGTVDVEHGAGREDVDTVLRNVADRCLPPLAPEAAGLGEGLHAGGVATGGGNDVDHGEEGVPAVEGGPGTPHDLDVVDGFEIDAEILAEIPLLVEVVVV